MKKTRLLSLALVVAVLLMGAGYALWSEALKIDGEICTGELDFKLSGSYVDSSCYADGSFEVDGSGHTAELKLWNVAPGEESEFKICIENTGTIGIVVEDFTVTGNNVALNQITIGSKSVEDYFTELFAGKVLEPKDKSNPGSTAHILCEEVVFYVDWNADEDTFPEDICFDLLIEANVTQSCYEDYGNGGEEDPDPEPECPTGMKFVKTKIETVKEWVPGCYGGGYWKETEDRKISGKFYFTCEGKNDVKAGSIFGDLIENDTSKDYTYTSANNKSFTITIKNTNGTISWDDV